MENLHFDRTYYESGTSTRQYLPLTWMVQGFKCSSLQIFKKQPIKFSII